MRDAGGLVVDDGRRSGQRSRSVVLLYGEREEKTVTGFWTPARMGDISVRPMSARGEVSRKTQTQTRLRGSARQSGEQLKKSNLVKVPCKSPRGVTFGVEASDSVSLSRFSCHNACIEPRESIHPKSKHILQENRPASTHSFPLVLMVHACMHDHVYRPAITALPWEECSYLHLVQHLGSQHE